MHDWFTFEGSPSPLGVTWLEDEAAYNFALYSKHATAVTLLLYSDHVTWQHRDASHHSSKNVITDVFVGALEGAAVVGSLCAIGGRLHSIGLPKENIIECETQFDPSRFLVIACGASDE
jgi:hypothetical protein